MQLLFIRNIEIILIFASNVLFKLTRLTSTEIILKRVINMKLSVFFVNMHISY